jgi:hypothetical protein
MTIQLSLFLDDSKTLHCEAPGRNGARRKIPLYDTPVARSRESLAAIIRDASYAMADELISQLERAEADAKIAAKRKQELSQQIRERVVEYIAANHPAQLRHFANLPPTKLNNSMRAWLASDAGGKFTSAEIDLMQQRGELGGTAFFTIPQRLRTKEITRIVL